MAGRLDNLLDPEFRFKPRIAGRQDRSEAHRVTSVRAALSGLARTKPYDVGETPRNSRRCVAKSHYVSTARGGRHAAARHLANLERDGVERDGSPGQLYGPDEAFDSEAFAEPVKGEKRRFRFIGSPENDAQIDLHAFARDLVSQMEKDLGRRFVWAAVSVTDGVRVPVTFFSARPRTTVRFSVLSRMKWGLAADAL